MHHLIVRLTKEQISKLQKLAKDGETEFYCIIKKEPRKVNAGSFILLQAKPMGKIKVIGTIKKIDLMTKPLDVPNYLEKDLWRREGEWVVIFQEQRWISAWPCKMRGDSRVISHRKYRRLMRMELGLCTW